MISLDDLCLYIPPHPGAVVKPGVTQADGGFDDIFFGVSVAVYFLELILGCGYRSEKDLGWG